MGQRSRVQASPDQTPGHWLSTRRAAPGYRLILSPKTLHWKLRPAGQIAHMGRRSLRRLGVPEPSSRLAGHACPPVLLLKRCRRHCPAFRLAPLALLPAALDLLSRKEGLVYLPGQQRKNCQKQCLLGQMAFLVWRLLVRVMAPALSSRLAARGDQPVQNVKGSQRYLHPVQRQPLHTNQMNLSAEQTSHHHPDGASIRAIVHHRPTSAPKEAQRWDCLPKDRFLDVPAAVLAAERLVRSEERRVGK